ncbi:hypothetical protein GCM10010524_51980 [Streptomyces mexicanus]|jgi:hypothetical protein
MAERAEGTASAGVGSASVTGGGASAAGPLALFSSVSGVLAVGLGALAGLLVPGGAPRGIVWLLVTALVAVAAGLWWGLTPVTERLRILNRALAAVQSRSAPRR